MIKGCVKVEIIKVEDLLGESILKFGLWIQKLGSKYWN